MGYAKTLLLLHDGIIMNWKELAVIQDQTAALIQASTDLTTTQFCSNCVGTNEDEQCCYCSYLLQATHT